MADIALLQKIATQTRRDIIRMVSAASSGHPGGALGCADLMTALFSGGVLEQKPQTWRLDGKGHDMFFLSIGHISAVYYSALARAGYFDLKELATFRKYGSRLQGHPTPEKQLPGIHVASGSLGQGLSVACGAALSKRLNNDPHLVYVLLGDGELEEGQNWEAAMFANAREIDNLIAIVDWNKKQIDGDTEDVLKLGDLDAKWKAFGWQTLCINGNDMTEVLQALKSAKALCGQKKPTLLLMKTAMGCGVDFMRDDYRWHGKAPNAEQTEKALAQLPQTLVDY